MNESIKRAYSDFKADAKGPVWQFAGLAIILTLVAWFSLRSGQNKREDLAFISEPKAGDVYNYKAGYKQFTTFRVSRVVGDSVFVNRNSYEVNLRRATDEIDIPENYVFWETGFLKSEIAAMYDADEIYDVKRLDKGDS